MDAYGNCIDPYAPKCDTGIWVLSASGQLNCQTDNQQSGGTTGGTGGTTGGTGGTTGGTGGTTGSSPSDLTPVTNAIKALQDSLVGSDASAIPGFAGNSDSGITTSSGDFTPGSGTSTLGNCTPSATNTCAAGVSVPIVTSGLTVSSVDEKVQLDSPFTAGDVAIITALIPVLPTSSCSYEIHKNVFGHAIDIAPCQQLQILRDILNWAFGVLTAVSVFRVAFKSNK
jgi:hypothetical protein